MKNDKFNKRFNNIKIIIFKKQRERYIADLTDIPAELLINNKNYKYIYTIKDHFSKFSWSYLLENKTSLSILKYTEKFFSKYGECIEMGTDNGWEFVNHILINFLTEKKIKLINGSPYDPHTQGSVERIHREIRKGLLCALLEDTKNFDLKKSLKNVMNNYNNNVNIITKYIPLEIFYSTNESLLKNVYDNTFN